MDCSSSKPLLLFPAPFAFISSACFCSSTFLWGRRIAVSLALAPLITLVLWSVAVVVPRLQPSRFSSKALSSCQLFIEALRSSRRLFSAASSSSISRSSHHCFCAAARFLDRRSSSSRCALAQIFEVGFVAPSHPPIGFNLMTSTRVPPARWTYTSARPRPICIRSSSARLRLPVMPPGQEPSRFLDPAASELPAAMRALWSVHRKHQ